MKKGYFYIAVTTLIFSTIEIVLKLTHGAFHPTQMTLARFLLGGLALAPFALRQLHRKGLHIDRRDLPRFALLGLMGVVLSMVLFQASLDWMPAGPVAVLFSVNPVFVTLLAFLILHEPIHKHNVLALVLEVAGSLIIIDPLHVPYAPQGVALVLGSVVAFSVYGVLGKPFCVKYGGLVNACVSFLMGSGLLLGIILLGRVPAVSGLLQACGLGLLADVPLVAGLTLQNLPLVLYICLVGTGVAYTCYFAAMEVTSAKETSLVFFFKPALAPVLSLLILGERIQPNMMAGIVLILAGSLSALLPDLLAQHREHAHSAARP